jgi:hypothetical protein
VTWSCILFVFTFYGVEETALAGGKFTIFFEDGTLRYTGQDDVAYTVFIQ